MGNLTSLLTFMILNILLFWVLYGLLIKFFGQKTRSQQQRRAFTGPHTRTSLSQSEPTIYVSPAHLPPPPKYESMAPPSYDEVVGIHYPQYQFPVQPITQPITTALGQSSNSTTEIANAANGANPANAANTDATSPNRSEADNAQSIVNTATTDESRTTVTVASS